MTIREIQKKIADALNGVEELVQGGCTALAEDSQNVFFEVKHARRAAAGTASPWRCSLRCNARSVPT